jgi:seryl-tRNA synthetase
LQKNDLVRLNQALVNYGMDIVSKHGYTLMETPDMAKVEILEGIGFNPRGAETQGLLCRKHRPLSYWNSRNYSWGISPK